MPRNVHIALFAGLAALALAAAPARAAPFTYDGPPLGQLQPWLINRCPVSGTVPEMVLSPGVVQDDALRFAVKVYSAGGTCWSGGVCDRLERQLPDGTWEPVDRSACPAFEVSGYQPAGTAQADAFSLPADSPAGLYRFTYGLGYWLYWERSRQALSATFTIAPPPSTGGGGSPGFPGGGSVGFPG